MSGEIEIWEDDHSSLSVIRKDGRREYHRDFGHGPSGLPRPDWLMFGVPRPDGSFRLYACKDVKTADVAVVERYAFSPAVIDVHAEMRQTLIIDGASYGECLARMAEIWRNWDADGREITS